MQATSALSLRALTARIHPQLPLTPRESAQLLAILTTSFNKQLDRHYPTSSYHSPRPSGLSRLNDHLGALLSSPLLSKKPTATSFSQHPIVTTAAPFRLHRQLSWLEDRVASATVTLPDFALSLTNIRNALSREPETTVIAIKELSAGSKIARWLKTSGRTSETDLMTGGKEPALLRNTLIDILVVEGRQKLIWEWLKSASFVPHGSVFSRLLFAEIQYGSGVEAAMLAFLNAPRHGYHGPRRAAIIASHYLSTPCPTVSLDIFLRFLAAIRAQPENLFASAVMSMCHPQQPSTKEGMAYVTAQANKFATFGKHDMPQALSRRHVAFFLSLSRLLLSKDQVENADFVLRFTQEHFQSELGIEERQLDPKSKPLVSETSAWTGTSEEENLQQLDGLLAT